MTFGLPFLIFFHVFSEILENVKYISRLMYFVVLSLQKMIKKRYIFIKNFILFHDSLFYRFFIDFGGPGASENGAAAPGTRLQKKRSLP